MVKIMRGLYRTTTTFKTWKYSTNGFFYKFLKATAEGIIKTFKNRILSRFGVPKVFITANGAQFQSRAFKRFLQP